MKEKKTLNKCSLGIQWHKKMNTDFVNLVLIYCISIPSHYIKYHFIFIQNLFPDIHIAAVQQPWGRTFCLDFSVSRLVAFWDGLRPISCPECSELCSHADPCLGLNGQRSPWLKFFLVRNESLIEIVLCKPKYP